MCFTKKCCYNKYTRGEEMKLLYWNLHKKAIEENIKELIEEQNIDIAIFSEYNGITLDKLINDKLNNEYKYYKDQTCDKIILIAKNNIEIQMKRGQHRYVIYSVKCEQTSYLMVGIHLPANPYSDENDRKIIIRDIVTDLKIEETNDKHTNSIIIGDFNCDPFANELVQKDSFNAVLFKKILEKKEHVKHQNHYYRLMYNPALNFISEKNEQYGSYYYSSGINALYWHCYDQIIMSKSLTESFKYMEYLHTIGNKSLLKEVKPNADISDHLPLIAEFERRNNNG